MEILTTWTREYIYIYIYEQKCVINNSQATDSTEELILSSLWQDHIGDVDVVVMLWH